MSYERTGDVQPVLSVEPIERTFEMDAKRFYVPAVLRAVCPFCGQTVEKDLTKDYLPYPTAGAPFTYTVYHSYIEGGEDHEHEFPVRIKLTVSIEAV